MTIHKIEKLQPAYSGFGDRGRTVRRAAVYGVVTPEGIQRAEIRRTSDPTYGDSPEWRVQIYSTDGDRPAGNAYARTLAEAKVKALSLLSRVDAAEAEEAERVASRLIARGY